MATYTLGQAAIINRGDYSSSAAYKQLNTVSHRRGTFMCIANCSNIEPGVNANWRNYWVMTAAGIYNVSVASTNATVTMTITLSDGTSVPLTYDASAIAAGSVTNESLGEVISIENGGTGASTAEEARANLGLPLPLALTSGGTGANNADSARANLNAQAAIVYYQVSISGSASSWTVTKDVNNNNLTNVKEGSGLFVSPDPASWANYRNYGVRLSAQANGSLTFVSESTVPSGTTLTINIGVAN